MSVFWSLYYTTAVRFSGLKFLTFFSQAEFLSGFYNCSLRLSIFSGIYSINMCLFSWLPIFFFLSRHLPFFDISAIFQWLLIRPSKICYSALQISYHQVYSIIYLCLLHWSVFIYASVHIFLEKNLGILARKIQKTFTEHAEVKFT